MGRKTKFKSATKSSVQYHRGFMAGVALAMADLNRSNDLPSACVEVLRSVGTYKDFVKAGVEKYDLKELRKIRRKENW